MATGDQTDIGARLNAELPPWFASVNPVLGALLAGIAAVLSWVYGLYAYAKMQTRRLTATDIWLDLYAQDYFGTALTRNTNESDVSFRARIGAALFQQRATRSALVAVVESLTGYAPTIVEPWSPMDCGAYGVGYCGYGNAGYYGSTLLPAQAFMIVYRAANVGIANVAGYGFPQAGYAVGSQADYASIAFSGTSVSDAGIMAAIDATKAAGVAIWVCLTTPRPGMKMDFSNAFNSGLIPLT
jgi:hypothetical protein